MRTPLSFLITPLAIICRHPIAVSVGAAIGSLFGLNGFGGALSGAIPGAVIGVMLAVAIRGDPGGPRNDLHG